MHVCGAGRAAAFCIIETRRTSGGECGMSTAVDDLPRRHQAAGDSSNDDDVVGALSRVRPIFDVSLIEEAWFWRRRVKGHRTRRTCCPPGLTPAIANCNRCMN